MSPPGKCPLPWVTSGVCKLSPSPRGSWGCTHGQGQACCWSSRGAPGWPPCNLWLRVNPQQARSRCSSDASTPAWEQVPGPGSCIARTKEGREQPLSRLIRILGALTQKRGKPWAKTASCEAAPLSLPPHSTPPSLPSAELLLPTVLLLWARSHRQPSLGTL